MEDKNIQYYTLSVFVYALQCFTGATEQSARSEFWKQMSPLPDTVTWPAAVGESADSTFYTSSAIKQLIL